MAVNYCAALWLVALLFVLHQDAAVGHTTVASQDADASEPLKNWGPSRRAQDEYRTFSESTVRVASPENTRRTLKSTLQMQGGHSSEIAVNITAFGKTFELKLTRNRRLMGASFFVKIVSSNGSSFVNNVDNTSDHCYYIGTVNGQVDSTAAISTCNGILGYFEVDGEAYSIEPVDGSIDGAYRVYRESDSLVPASSCGNSPGSNEQTLGSTQDSSRKKRSFSWPQDADGRARVVEFYVVNDHSQYLAMGSVNVVITRTKEIVNIASALFHQLDIYIVLVGIEIWKDADLIAVNPANSSETLNNFNDYRRTHINPFHPNDNAQLVSNVTYANGIAGLALLNGMCGYTTSSAIITDKGTMPAPAATTMAHEMGHNFGFEHDDQLPGPCTCNDPTGSCIMKSTLGNVPQTRWSQCSKNQLSVSFDQLIDMCLHNVPETLYDPSPFCGNGVVDSGEQCDCRGVPPEECNQACCDPTTCRLVAPATCAAGRCCDIPNCRLRPQSSPCRQSSGPCDLSEYCSGVDALCPSDVYMQDGTACTDTTGSSAYCSGGQCRSHRSQCQLWFGTTADNGVDTCYSRFNNQPVPAINGNCGYNASGNGTYRACAASDVKCGLLQCDFNLTSLSDLHHFGFSSMSISAAGSGPVTYLGQQHNCAIGTFNVFYAGSDTVDPGLVPDGAACGTNMMCLSQKCVNISSLDAMACPDCHQHGVCNNFGECHCDVGFAPPDCSQPGDGGSIHSNPMTVGGAVVTNPPRATVGVNTAMTMNPRWTSAAHSNSSVTTISSNRSSTTKSPKSGVPPSIPRIVSKSFAIACGGLASALLLLQL